MIIDKSISFFASFNIIKINENDYSIPYTHYVYIKYLSEHYLKVILICGIREQELLEQKYLVSDFKNVEVVPLPYIKNYFSAQTKLFKFFNILKTELKKTDIVYCRVPGPFSWMPRLLFHKKTIMHFVGDTIDATKHNEKWSALKKYIMILGYKPDYWLTLKAARKSKVYTNGYHLSEKLYSKGINATSVVSSTISANSLIKPKEFKKNQRLSLIYIGYIRFAKGINCLMELSNLLKMKYPDFKFDIVGDGEMFLELKKYIEDKDLCANVILHGHIENRDKLNELLRNNDLFIFPSLSEGSPRVVIEAMASGIPVVSTPVGSLPTVFKDKESIRFFDFNNPNLALEIIDEFVNDSTPFKNQREIAYKLVETNYTIEAFLSKIFSYEA